MEDLKLTAEGRERLEKQLLEAFGKLELERLARRVGIELGQIAEGPPRETVTGLIDEVLRLGLLRELVRMARRINPTHPGLNNVLAGMLPRVFKPDQVAELVKLLQESGLPWSTLEHHFWSSIPSTWTRAFTELQEERERVEELVDVLADFPDRDALGRASPLFEFVLRLSNSPEAAGVAERLRKWLERAALALGKDLNRIKAQGYQLLGELYLMVKLERATADGFRVEAWLADEQSRFPRVIFQEERAWKLEEVPQALKRIWLRRELAEPLKQLGDAKLTVEFLLPRELLLHAVEDWRVLPGAPIGARYQVVVRSLERAYAEVKTPLEVELEDLPLASAPWNEKWRLFSSSPQSPARPVWVHRPADHQGNRFFADLVLPEVVCLALTMTPPAISEMTLRELLRHCLVNGMPMALWARKPEGSGEEIQTFFDGLLKELSQLPGAVRQARWQGFSSDDAGHLGKHLTLVWDDPNRLPADARPGADFSAPGQMGVTG
ncbi:MAG TPA: effector-associated domain EAD1-containing protein [Archangium sp.]|nr:effector-associated domain EAD1-containing protein [Archangium sp.]